jgi:hypothetical protein
MLRSAFYSPAYREVVMSFVRIRLAREKKDASGRMCKDLGWRDERRQCRHSERFGGGSILTEMKLEFTYPSNRSPFSRHCRPSAKTALGGPPQVLKEEQAGSSLSIKRLPRRNDCVVASQILRVVRVKNSEIIIRHVRRLVSGSSVGSDIRQKWINDRNILLAQNHGSIALVLDLNLQRKVSQANQLVKTVTIRLRD